MIDMSATILAKSDQLNADDLLTGPRTITITKVAVNPRDEQPATLHYDGDGGKPYKPCKTMRRVLVAIWGPDASQYVGRSMTIYRDPDVTFGGLQVGGIRISHMSHLENRRSLALTATRGRKAAYVVQPLRAAAGQQPAAQQSGDAPPARSKADKLADDIVAAFERCTNAQEVMRLVDRTRTPLDSLRQLADQSAFQRADAARAAAYQRHVQPPDDDLPVLSDDPLGAPA